MSENRVIDIPVKFETTIPGNQGPGGEMFPYDLELPHLRAAMIQKIETNIKQFGSVEKFLESFARELSEKYDAAESAVRVYWMRRIQMDFMARWMEENTTKKDGLLDGPEVSSARP